MNYAKTPISDAHIHVFWDMPLEKREEQLKRVMEECGYDTVTVLAIPYATSRLTKCRDFTENLQAFYLKHKMPGRVYAFAGFAHSHDKAKNTPEFFLEQAKFYMAAGFDGIKMIEGRARQRYVCGGFSDPKYELVFDYAEKEQIPMVLHANAPECWWREGYPLYGTKGGELSWMDYYEDVVAVLKKHPRLRLTLAHFFFGSERPALMRELLDTYENVCFDVCPNPFMYIDFAKDEPTWRAFFEKYQDRIIYGTDIGSNTVDTDGTEASALYRMVRGFLENDAPFEELGWNVPPLRMPENILRKIYKDNMMAFYQGKAPKALDYTVMKRELDTVLNEWEIFLNIDDLANLNLIKTIF